MPFIFVGPRHVKYGLLILILEREDEQTRRECAVRHLIHFCIKEKIEFLPGLTIIALVALIALTLIALTLTLIALILTLAPSPTTKLTFLVLHSATATTGQPSWFLSAKSFPRKNFVYTSAVITNNALGAGDY